MIITYENQKFVNLVGKKKMKLPTEVKIGKT